MQSDTEEVDCSERVGPRAQFCCHRCQDTGKLTALPCHFCVCCALMKVWWSVAVSLGVWYHMGSELYTRHCGNCELLPRRQLAQWEDRIERNKMAVGGGERSALWDILRG